MADTVVECADVSGCVTSGNMEDKRPLLLIVVGEPFSANHKQAIISRISTELSSWDKTASGCDLEQQLVNLPEPTVISLSAIAAGTAAAATAGETLLEWKTEAVDIKVLVNSCVKTVLSTIREFVIVSASYRYILYSGHTVDGSGSWLLRDGALHFAALAGEFHARLAGTGPVDVGSFLDVEWTPASLARLDKRVRFIPTKQQDVAAAVDKFSESVEKFAASIASHVAVRSTMELLEATDVIGIVPFHRPTLYVFQGGDGASALFGINGFTMLVDCGYPRRACFWEFVRHLDRIDAVMFSHLGVDSILGMSTFVERLSLGGVQTSIGQVFFNAFSTGGNKPIAVGDANSPVDGSDIVVENGKFADSLLLCLAEEGISMIDRLHQLKIPIATCVASTTANINPINLYHKIGFGSLDLYVLTPSADSKELKEFLTSRQKHFKSSHGSFLSEQISVSFVLVFKPSRHADRPVRILFPGSTPQSKLFDGLNRIKALPLFTSVEGSEKPAVTKLATVATPKCATARPAASAPAVKSSTDFKPANAPVAKSSTDSKPLVASVMKSSINSKPSPAKTDAKDFKKPASIAIDGDTSQKDAKKTAPADARKPTENKQPRSVTHDAKKTAEVKPSIVTSTPRKDAPKPVPPRVDAPRKNSSHSARAPRKVEEPMNKDGQKQNGMATAATSGNGKPGVKQTSKKLSDAGNKVATSKPIVEVNNTVEEPVLKTDGDQLAVGVVSELGVETQRDIVDVSEGTKDAVSVCQGDMITAVTDQRVLAEDDCSATQADEVKVEDTENTTSEISSATRTVEADPSSSQFNPGQEWDMPQNLPAPADDKDGNIKTGTTAAVAAAEKQRDTGKKSASGEKVKSVRPTTTKHPATTDRLNQTVISGSKVSVGDTSGAASKSGRLSLQPKELKHLSSAGGSVKSAVEVSTASRFDASVARPATASHAAATTRKPVPSASKSITPFYVDLAYVPVHVANQYNAEYFLRVRARRYVVPGAVADPRILAWLVDAKSTWEGEVSVIPTGDSEAMMAWVEGHHDQLVELKISVAPSVSQSSLVLQQGSTCQASRIEF